MDGTSFYPQANVIHLRNISPYKNMFISGIKNVFIFLHENVIISDYSNVYSTNVVPWNQVNSRNFTTKSNLIKPNLPNLISFKTKKYFICIADYNANFTTILLHSGICTKKQACLHVAAAHYTSLETV